MGGYAGLNHGEPHRRKIAWPVRRNGIFLTGGSYDVAVRFVPLSDGLMDTTATIPTAQWRALEILSLLLTACWWDRSSIGFWELGMGRRLAGNVGIEFWPWTDVDFAGSSVAYDRRSPPLSERMIGPRIGKFKKDGTAVPIPGHKHSFGDGRNFHPGV
jgi:Amt family ammonium transporter